MGICEACHGADVGEVFVWICRSENVMESVVNGESDGRSQWDVPGMVSDGGGDPHAVTGSVE